MSIRPTASRRRPMLIAVVLLCAPAVANGDEEKANQPKWSDEAAGRLVAHFTDGSLLRVKFAAEKIPITTRYGKIDIPTADILSIEFASRTTDAQRKKVSQLMAKLAQAAEWKTAAVELLAMRAAAHPAVLKATQSSDAQLAGRAKLVLGRLNQVVPENMQRPRTDDKIRTSRSTFVGKIGLDSIELATVPFGIQPAKLSDLASMGELARRQPQQLGNVLPDPGNLTAYRGQVGKKLLFRVNGRIQGSLWGTDLYTLDSSLAMAAVHAGALKAGQAGVVQVTIVGPQPQFLGSTRNGITSSPWQTYPGAFKVSKVKSGRVRHDHHH